jgi:hypothetical protein
MIKLTGFALTGWIIGGLAGIDAYLFLDLLKQPEFLWMHVAAIWGVAFMNIVFIFMATLVYGSAKAA